MGLLIDIIEERLIEPRDGVEVGVSRGATSRALLRRFLSLRLIMVDAWAVYPPDHPYRRSGDGHAKLTAAEQNRNCEGAHAVTAFAKDRRYILRADSVAAAKMFPVNGFGAKADFVFVDGDHTFDGVAADINAWLPHVRSGGLMLGHDIDHPRDRRGVWGVRRAVEAAFGPEGFEVRGDLWWHEVT